MDENTIEDLKCPICLEIPQNEIFQCENGHTLCSRCYSTLKECPQCRINFKGKGIRNRALESLLDKIKFDCIYKTRGCNEKISRQKRRGHEEICVFGNNGIQLCRELGLSCEACINQTNLSATLSHLQIDHGFIMRHDTELRIGIEEIKEIPTNMKSFWTPIIFDHRETSGFVWILIILYNQANKTIFPVCIKISGDKTNVHMKTQLQANFTIRSVETALQQHLPDIMWSASPIDLELACMMINSPQIGISVEALYFGYTDDSTFYINYSDTKCIPGGEKRKDITTLYIFNKYAETLQVGTSFAPVPPKYTRDLGERRTAALKRCILPISLDKTQLENLQFESFAHATSDRIITGPAVFKGVLCDVCRKVPVYARYKCLQCANYDLCGNCFQSENHKHHVFAILLNNNQGDLFTRNLKHPDGWKPFFPNEVFPSLTSNPYTAYLNCSNCPNASIYICLICKPLFGYCNRCFNMFILEHANDHSFAVANTEIKMQMVLDKLILNKYNGFHLKRV